ncbi:Protein LIKE COV 2 [Linum perenne]
MYRCGGTKLMAADKDSPSNSEKQDLTRHDSDSDSEDVPKSPPGSPGSSTRKACYAVLQSWVSKKFMTGCIVLFPVAVTVLVTWWFVEFVDSFFSPVYEQLGVDIFGLGFITSLLFLFFVGIFASSWLGATVFWLGELLIKQMPFVKHLYSASKQLSAAISPDQNTNAFKEVAIIRHPRQGEYAFGFITSTVLLQREEGDEELCSVYVPTNHLYIGDIFLVNSKDIFRPNMSIREGIGPISSPLTLELCCFVILYSFPDCLLCIWLISTPLGFV